MPIPKPPNIAGNTQSNSPDKNAVKLVTAKAVKVAM